MNRKIAPAFVVLALALLPTITNASFSESSFSTVSHFVTLTKVLRFFALEEQKPQLSLAIENGLLLQAENQIAAGQMSDAAATLKNFQQERASLQSTIKTILTSSPTHTQTQLVRDVVTDLAVQGEVLKKNTVAQVPNISNLQTESTDQIGTILASPSLSEEERILQLTAVIGEVSKTVSKPEDKLAAKLALNNTLSDITQDSSLKQTLSQQEDLSVSGAAALDATQINTLITKLQSEKPRHKLVVLQKLLNQAPSTAVSSVQTALNSEIEHEVSDTTNGKSDLESLGMDTTIPFTVRSEILDKAKGKSHDTTLTTAITNTLVAGQKEDSNHQLGLDDHHGSALPKPAPTASPAHSTTSASDSPAQIQTSGHYGDDKNTSPAFTPPIPQTHSTPELHLAPSSVPSATPHNDEPSTPTTTNPIPTESSHSESTTSTSPTPTSTSGGSGSHH